MYKTTVNEQYYLVDKNENIIMRTFNSIVEVRAYLSRLCEEADTFWARCHKMVTLNDLSMIDRVTYIESKENVLKGYVKEEPTEDYPYERVRPIYCTQRVSRPHRNYYILKSDGTIFNYTLLLDEVILYKKNAKKYRFGIGITYKGSDTTPSEKKDWDTRDYHTWSKRHGRGKSAYHDCISKYEIIQTEDINTDEIYQECLEEGYDVDYETVKKASESMKGSRKLQKNFTCFPNTPRGGKSLSWKRNKKRCQWM